MLFFQIKTFCIVDWKFELEMYIFYVRVHNFIEISIVVAILTEVIGFLFTLRNINLFLRTQIFLERPLLDILRHVLFLL